MHKSLQKRASKSTTPPPKPRPKRGAPKPSKTKSTHPISKHQRQLVTSSIKSQIIPFSHQQIDNKAISLQNFRKIPYKIQFSSQNVSIAHTIRPIQHQQQRLISVHKQQSHFGLQSPRNYLKQPQKQSNVIKNGIENIISSYQSNLIPIQALPSRLVPYSIQKVQFSGSSSSLNPKSDPFPTYRGDDLSGSLYRNINSRFNQNSQNHSQNYSQNSQNYSQNERTQNYSQNYSQNESNNDSNDQIYNNNNQRNYRPNNSTHPSTHPSPNHSNRPHPQDQEHPDNRSNNDPDRYENDGEYEYDDDEYDDDDDDDDDDEMGYSGSEDDPNAFRLVIPNRYSIEDFLKVKSNRLRERVELDVQDDIRRNGQADQDDGFGSLGLTSKYKKWKKNRELSKFDDEDFKIDGIDSDLELYGGINLEKYTKVVLEPSKGFSDIILKSRQVPDEYSLNTIQFTTPNTPMPVPGVSIFNSNFENFSKNKNFVNQTPTFQKNHNNNNNTIGSTWSKMVGNYSPGNEIIDKTASKSNSLINSMNSPERVEQGADYLKQRLDKRYPEVADQIDKHAGIEKNNNENEKNNIENFTKNGKKFLKNLFSTPSEKRHHFMNVTQKKVYSKDSLKSDPNLTQYTLPPSKQSAKGYSFSPRDAYESQMFIVNRIQTDNKLRQSLRDTFKFYTKELDPLTGIEACRHLLSIEMYLYLKTLEDTGVKLTFSESTSSINPNQEKLSFFDKLRGKDKQMSTSSVMALMQEYRTNYLEMIQNDESGELLAILEEEWVQLIHLVAEINPEVIRNSYIDIGTAHELLAELKRGVDSDQYVLDFEDQLNCILIQFAKQRRERWDGVAYNTWKENRLSQLKSGLIHYQEKEKYNEKNMAQVKFIERQIRQIELMGDDSNNAEMINNDTLIEQIILELDMPKLKFYVNNALLYFYRNHLYSQYGFENDIGSLLITKALHSIPDINIFYMLDDISESANRCRDFSLETNPNGQLTDNDNSEWDDEQAEIDNYDRRIDVAQDRLTKRQFKQQVLKEKLDPDYNENFPAGFRDWFYRKQDQEDDYYNQKNSKKYKKEQIFNKMFFQKKKKNEKLSKKYEFEYENPSSSASSSSSSLSSTLSQDYLQYGIPQYDGKYDQYGLPQINQPPKRNREYSSVIDRYQHQNNNNGQTGPNGQNQYQDIHNGKKRTYHDQLLETGKPLIKQWAPNDKRK